jgi:hypothetical protein
MEAANKKVAVCVVSRYLKESKYSDELQKGIEVEKEHSDVYDFLEKFLKKAKIEMPFTLDEFAAMIAKSHLKEMSDYYTRLAEMEGKSHKEAMNFSGIGYKAAVSRAMTAAIDGGMDIVKKIVERPQSDRKYYTNGYGILRKWQKEKQDQPVSETSPGVGDGYNIMQNVVKNPQKIKKA